MRNKKGFTLVELLCVIVLLAILTVAGASGILKLTQNSKENMYCAKLELIESFAQDYAVKFERELNDSTELYEGYKSLKIKVADLVRDGVLEEEDIISPLDDKSLGEKEIIIYLKNNRINVFIDSNNIC